jgi:SlyX protein
VATEDRTEDRLVEIEIKLAYQEDLVESLNTTVYQQQLQIDKLEALFSALAQQVRDNAQQHPALGGSQERPPHY